MDLGDEIGVARLVADFHRAVLGLVADDLGAVLRLLVALLTAILGLVPDLLGAVLGFFRAFLGLVLDRSGSALGAGVQVDDDPVVDTRDAADLGEVPGFRAIGFRRDRAGERRYAAIDRNVDVVLLERRVAVNPAFD